MHLGESIIDFKLPQNLLEKPPIAIRLQVVVIVGVTDLAC